jgi:hypothetical protein
LVVVGDQLVVAPPTQILSPLQVVKTGRRLVRPVERTIGLKLSRRPRTTRSPSAFGTITDADLTPRLGDGRSASTPLSCQQNIDAPVMPAKHQGRAVRML